MLQILEHFYFMYNIMNVSVDPVKNIQLLNHKSAVSKSWQENSLLDDAARQRLLDNKLSRAQHYTQVAQSLKLAKYHSKN